MLYIYLLFAFLLTVSSIYLVYFRQHVWYQELAGHLFLISAIVIMGFAFLEAGVDKAAAHHAHLEMLKEFNIYGRDDR